MEATVILARCPDNRQVYGMRTEKMPDGDWRRNWAFAIDERRAKSEGYDRLKVRGSLRYTAEYPGCPYCGAKNLVQCGNCGKLTCWKGEEELACAWCGIGMGGFERVSEVRVSGGEM